MLRQLFGTCNVHKVSLLKEKVPIRYGLIRFSAGYGIAKKQLFPNSCSFVLGGCLVSPRNPMTRKVNYCPKCREAEKGWQESHESETTPGLQQETKSHGQ